MDARGCDFEELRLVDSLTLRASRVKEETPNRIVHKLYE